MEKSILITFKGEIAMDNNAPVIDTKKNAAKFYKVVETYIKRDGINDLMDWLGSTDFLRLPPLPDSMVPMKAVCVSTA